MRQNRCHWRNGAQKRTRNLWIQWVIFKTDIRVRGGTIGGFAARCVRSTGGGGGLGSDLLPDGSALGSQYALGHLLRSGRLCDLARHAPVTTWGGCEHISLLVSAGAVSTAAPVYTCPMPDIAFCAETI